MSLLSPRVSHAVKAASLKLSLRGLVVFCAIILNGLLTQLVQVTVKQHSTITKLMFALMFHGLSSVSPFLLHLQNGSGNFSLEMMTEMCAWAWVAVIDSVLFYSDDFMETVSIFFVCLLVGVPCIILLLRLFRERVHTSSKVEEALDDFDLEVCSYSLGFVTNAFFNGLVYRCVYSHSNSSSNHASFGVYVFILESSIAARLLYTLEISSVRLEGSFKWATSTVVSVLDKSLGVAVGFAWIGLFRNLFNALVFTATHEDVPDVDDASWLEEDEEEGKLNSEQVGFVWLWFLIVLVNSFLVFVWLTIQLNRRSPPGCWSQFKSRLCCRAPQNDAVKRATKRRRAELLLEAIALAIGFAAEKSLGESLHSWFGEDNVLSIVSRASLSAVVVGGLFLQHIKGGNNSRPVSTGNVSLQEQLIDDDESIDDASDGMDEDDRIESEDQFNPVLRQSLEEPDHELGQSESIESQFSDVARTSSEVRTRNEDSGEWL